MSITAAFVASRSGLAAAEARSELTASNIANAGRAGYAHRSAPMTSVPGGGVGITGYARAADARLEQAHRQEMSRVATRETVATALESHAATLGEIDSGIGLHSRLMKLQSALDAAAADPSQPALQEEAVRSAIGMASSLREVAQSVVQIETQARAGAREDVEKINAQLGKIVEINRKIRAESSPTERRASLEDSLSSQLDALNEIIDVRVSFDSSGRISVFTPGGAPLVESDAARALVFDGETNGLSVDGIDVTPSVAGARGSQEGRLAGRLKLLNADLPRMQLQFDEMARVLVQGFEMADDSLSPDQPGLFTDEGAAYSPGRLEGLATRIAVNDAARSDKGGGAWRLRDGLGAEASGAASDGRRLDGFVTMLAAPASVNEAAGLGSERSLMSFAAGVIADQQQLRNTARDEVEALSAGRDAIEAARASVQGVNIDEELQQLMLIEQSYSANATVMRTLDEMMNTLFAAIR